MTDQGNSRPRRRLRPVHVVIVLVLVAVIGVWAFEWSHIAASAVGRGPRADRSAPGTTQAEAEAYSRGQGRQGSNSSDEAYTAQNQSRQPEAQR